MIDRILKKDLQYYYAVDFIRGLAAITILVWHYHHFYFTQPYFSAETGSPVWNYYVQPFYPVLKVFYHYGYWAVQFFWLLSGFVFAFVYSERKVNLKNFFILRFSRLYPLHLITLLFIALIQMVSLQVIGKYQILATNDLYHLFLNLFYAQAWGFEKAYSFNSPTWSVSIEEIVYYTFWLIVVRKGNLTIGKSLILCFVGFLCYPFLGLVGQCFLFFYCGAFIFKLQYNQKTIRYYLFFILFILFILLLILIIYFYIKGVLYFLGFDIFFKNISLIKNLLKMILFISGFSLIVLLGACVDRIGLLKKLNPMFKFVGSLTYSTYLWHLPVQVLVLFVFDVFSVNRDIFNSNFVFIIWIIFMIVAGRMSYLYIERPIQVYIRERYLSES